MIPELTVIILPGGLPGDLTATVDAIRADVGEEIEILTLDRSDDTAREREGAGLVAADPDELAGSDRILAFFRAGDRPVPGALAARIRTFTAYPGAGVAIAGHRLIAPDGTVSREVDPPSAGTDPDEILIRRSVEAAAVLARAEHLDAGHFDLLARPHGDIVVWSRVAHDSGYTRSGEVAADVPLDPGRHGQSGEAVLGPLFERVRAAGGPDGSGDSDTRRELLRRLYLAREDHDEPVNLAGLFAGKLDDPVAAAQVVEDLQWIAERQAEALELERLRWAEGIVKPEDEPPLTINEEILEAQATLGAMGARTAEMANGLRRLEAEVYRRDAIISQLEKVPLAEAHEIGEAAEAEQAAGHGNGEDR